MSGFFGRKLPGYVGDGLCVIAPAAADERGIPGVTVSRNVREFPFNSILLDKEPQSLTFQSFGATVRSLIPPESLVPEHRTQSAAAFRILSTLTFVQPGGITPRRVFQQFALTPLSLPES